MKSSPQSTLSSSPQSSLNKYISLFLSILSGILLSLPFFNGKLWIFAWFGFVPLFLAIQHKGRAKAFLFSYLTGIIFWSITIYWLIHVTLLGQILLILYLALYFGIFGLFISAICNLQSAICIFSIPSLWVILEYLRSHLLTGFGWALLGYSQYLNLPVIQIADLFGVYGVSFLVMMMNVTIHSVSGYRLAVSGKGRYLLPLVCIFITLLYGYYKTTQTPLTAHRSPLKISVIQGNIPQELKWAYGSKPFILERYVQLTEGAALDKPDVIIWPEASNPGFLGEEQDDRMSQAIFSVAKKTNVPLLFGSVVREQDKYFNSALLIDTQGKIAARYDKLHLVPFGEYIPLKRIFTFLETVVPIGDFTPGKEYTLFKLPVTSDQLPGVIHLSQVTGHRSQVTFAVLICFEDTVPELSRNFVYPVRNLFHFGDRPAVSNGVKRGADFLVNITNDAWFGRTSAPHQHLSASVFRAIENRVPLVRSANTGVSCFIDSCGRITAKLSEDDKGIFISGIKTGTITLDKGKSLYSAIGDMFVLGCLAMAGICGIIKIQNLKTKI